MSDDVTPLGPAMERLIQRHGVLPVWLALTRRMIRRVTRPARPAALGLNAHLRRDIGLPAVPDRPPDPLLW